jgi:hypothetical protein
MKNGMKVFIILAGFLFRFLVYLTNCREFFQPLVQVIGASNDFQNIEEAIFLKDIANDFYLNKDMLHVINFTPL